MRAALPIQAVSLRLLRVAACSKWCSEHALACRLCVLTADRAAVISKISYVECLAAWVAGAACDNGPKRDLVGELSASVR